MKRSISLKKILLIILIIIFLPIVILGLIFKYILSFFSNGKSALEKNIDEFVNMIRKEIKKEPSINSIIIDETLENKLSPMDAEKILLDSVIEILLKDKFKIKLKDLELRDFKKSISKEIKDKYDVKYLTVNRLKEKLIETMDVKLYPDKYVDEVKEQEVVENKKIVNINSEPILKKENIILEKKEKVKEILMSYKHIEEEVNEEVMDTVIENIIAFNAVDLVVDVLREEKLEEVVEVEFLDEIKELEQKEIILDAEEVEIKIKEELNEIQAEPKEETKKQEVEKEELLEKEKEKPSYRNINVHQIDNMLVFLYQVEMNKEDIEDRDYEHVEENVNAEIIRIENLKLLDNLDERTLNNLEEYRQKLYNLKDMAEEKVLEDNKEFKHELESDVSKSDESLHQEVLNEVDIKNRKLIGTKGLNNIDDLNLLDFDKAKEVEKDLIIRQLYKMSSPESIMKKFVNFFKSKVFKNYSTNKVVKKEINFLNNIVDRNNMNYVDNTHPTKNKDILEADVYQCEENINGLSYVNEKIKNKHPELCKNIEYNIAIKNVNDKLIKNQEKAKKKNKYKEKLYQRKPIQRTRN